jgi:hypothetical protein
MSMISQVGYHHKLIQYIRELIEIVRTRNIDTKKLFYKYDQNKSGAIEFD